jgi:hypothetical protein
MPNTIAKGGTLAGSNRAVILEHAYYFRLENTGANPTTVRIGKTATIVLQVNQVYEFQGNPLCPFMKNHDISALIDQGTTQVNYIVYYVAE